MPGVSHALGQVCVALLGDYWEVELHQSTPSKVRETFPMWHDTIARLSAFTDTVEFERLCADLLRLAGFIDIVPRGPGLRDGGIDAESGLLPRLQVFQFSLQSYWQQKLRSTLKKICTGGERRLENDGLLVFVTNQKVSPRSLDLARQKALTTYGVRVLILDREWLRIQLDTNPEIRKLYIGNVSTPAVSQKKINGQGLLEWFSFSDFIRHCFLVGVIQSRFDTTFFDEFVTCRIIPYLDNSSGRDTLFPTDPNSSTLTLDEPFPGTHEYPILRKIAGQDYTIPRTPTFYISDIQVDRKFDFTPARGCYIKRPLTPFLDRLLVSTFLLQYSDVQFRRVYEQAQQGGWEPAEQNLTQTNHMRQRMTTHLTNDLARAFQDDPSLQNLYDFMSERYLDKNWTIRPFLTAVGTPLILHNFTTCGSQLLLETTIELFCDVRVPATLQRDLLLIATRLHLSEDTISICKKSIEATEIHETPSD